MGCYLRAERRGRVVDEFAHRAAIERAPRDRDGARRVMTNEGGRSHDQQHVLQASGSSEANGRRRAGEAGTEQGEDMWVVKIGGSLSHDPALRDWLTQLWEVGGGRVVIVPGGGYFADRVRIYQKEWQFGDLAAHNMCLLAMTQYALMMQGVLPDLVLASNEDMIRRTLRNGQVAVWMP